MTKFEKGIALGCDHAGYALKEILKAYLKDNNISFEDFGTNSEESVDYPDFVHPVGFGIETGKFNAGIIICGSGNGVNMTVNKYPSVRSALCWEKEIASMARLHNDANIIAIPARYVAPEKALEILEAFLQTEFEGGRHLKRVEKIRMGIMQ